jgi:hypothetical protein
VACLAGWAGGVADAGAAVTEISCSPSSGNLQTAIDSAHTGDTLRIHGTCVGNYRIPGAGLAVTLTLQGVRNGILDGNRAGTTLTIESGTTVTITGLTITGGETANNGAGIAVISSNLNLVASTVSGNTSTQFGGGFALLGSNATVTNSSITGNSAAAGGGIDDDQDSTLTLSSSLVSNNTSSDGPDAGAGGGLDIYHSHATISNSRIVGNFSAGRGGGIQNEFGSSLQLRNSIVADNHTPGWGAAGGLLNDGATAAISNTLFDGNSSFGLAGDFGIGGGIYNESEAPFNDGTYSVSGQSSLTLENSILTHNTASFGSAISNIATGGQRATITASHLIISGNVSKAPPGRLGEGTIFNSDEGGGAVFSLSRSVVSGNRADHGGGIMNVAQGGLAQLALFDTPVTRNVANVDGGGIYNPDGGSVQLVRSPIALNRPNNCVGC